MLQVWIFVLLLAATAFFNLAEMALIAARSTTLAELEDPRAQLALVLKRRPGLFLAAIRAGDLITDLLTGAFVVTALEAVLRRSLEAAPLLQGVAGVVAALSAFAIISLFVLVFGDLAPKSIALNAPERAAVWVAPHLRLVIIVAQPFFLLLERANAFLLRLLGMRPGHEVIVTQAEIRRTLAEGLTTGALLGVERTMLERVLDLERRSVRSVMTGRPGLQFIRGGVSADALRQTALNASASRLLVFAPDRDEPIGIVRRADLLASPTLGDIDVSALTYPVEYVAESASVLDVLSALKRSEAGMAVVVDEFGAMLGVVTFADVLEAIAGDIPAADPGSGEGVALPASFRMERDGSILIDGTQPVDDLIEELNLRVPPEQSFKTVAGLVVSQARRLPAPGERLSFDGFTLEVVAADNGAVTMVRLWRSPPSQTECHE